MMNDGDAVTITRHTEEYLTIDAGDTHYEVGHDDWTGDWGVVEPGGPTQQWFLSKDGAIQWVLEREDVIVDADYQYAPDRTSA